MIKPHHWPWIEFLSSGGQEPQHCSRLSNNLSQSPSAVILEPKKMKSISFHFYPSYLPWSDGTRCHNLSFFFFWVFKLAFSLLFHFHQEALQFLLAFWLGCLRLLIFLLAILIPVVLHPACHFTKRILHVCVCVYIYIHIYIHIYVYIYTHTHIFCMYTHIHTHTHIYILYIYIALSYSFLNFVPVLFHVWF